MNIGVVLVTFNRLEKLKVALTCYANQTKKPQYIIVVDNCSTDGTDEFLNKWRLKEEGFQKQILFLSENTGGAGGFYEGMKVACQERAEWIWVSDDDAYPHEDAFERIEDYFESLQSIEKENISAICSAVYNKGQIHYAHRSYIRSSRWKVFIEPSADSEYKKKSFEFSILSYVGSCLSKAALEKVGLDEKDYFIYNDDQEHSIRLNKAGKFICVTDSIVDHDTPPYDPMEIKWGKYYGKRNELLMIRKHYPFRYFVLRYVKRYIKDVSFLSDNPKELRMIYKAAYKDALLNKKGLHKIYRPGWVHSGEDDI